MRISIPGLGKSLPDLGQALADELDGTVGVVDVAAAMQNIEDLPALSDRTEQGVVAALAFLALVEAAGDSLGAALGGNDAAIEIQSDPAEGFLSQTFENDFAHQILEFGYGPLVGAIEHAADRRYARNRSHAQDALDDRVVAIEIDIANIPESDQSVDHEQLEHGGEAKMRSSFDRNGASLQPAGQVQGFE